MPENLDLLVFGDIAIDYFYEVNRLPKINTASEILRAYRFYGGMGANTAVISSKLGLKTGLVSAIGTDAEDYKKYLESNGIRLFLKEIVDTACSIFFKSSKGEISFFHKSAAEELDRIIPGKDFSAGVIKNSKVIYLARTYLNLQKRILKFCKNKFLVYNPGYGIFKFDKIPKDFYRIIKRTNVLILNENEMEYLKRIGFKIDFKSGPDALLITKGKYGCSIYSKDLKINVPAYMVKVIDASGAGDSFNAGFVAARIKGYNTYNSVKIGNATASFIIEKWGCQTNIPTWNKVIGRYKRIKDE